MRRSAIAACTALILGAPLVARADDAPAITPEKIDLEKDTTKASAGAEIAEPPPEAPPPLPYKKTVVIDSSIGALTFLGKFGKVAPPGPWLHTQVGYELFRWFMLFGEGEIAFSDTSNTQDPPKVRAFPLFGFGGGARFTIRFTDRFGIYLQGSLGAMKVDISRNALGILGFRDAESLGAYAGGRLGVEWYQVDRHFGLGITSSIRDAQGFTKTGVSGGDTPLVLDVGASLRYAF
jgi:hypothetical protein